MDKKQQLRKSKRLATGLFLLMALVYILMIILLKDSPQNWMGYVKSFSEAAMVGALADWFAVTALFHHPLGIPIPHTNIIEKSKQKIGDNLGDFVTENFLNATNLRPYIQKLKVTPYITGFLEKEKNKELLLKEARILLLDIVNKTNDETVIQFIAKKGKSLTDEIQLAGILSNSLKYFVDQNAHEQWVTLLARKIKELIHENEDTVRDRVKKESYFFIPKFVDKKLADKISNGLVHYFEEIETDPDHRIRLEITKELYSFLESLKTKPKWQHEIEKLKDNFLSEEHLLKYARDIWMNLKSTIQEELEKEDSAFMNYLSGQLDELVSQFKNDLQLQEKTDQWVRHNAYSIILRNTSSVSRLISNTVGKWEGRELSEKLELEVGKDLQFIRINGTLVGGLVGLIIYTLTQLFS